LKDFNTRIRAAFGAAGEAWLAELPALLQQCAQRWSLELGEPFPLSYNYVTRATQRGAPVVLKIGVPQPELLTELAAMQRFAGEGAARQIAVDTDLGAQLLELVTPGDTLAAHFPVRDDDATRIAARVMRRLWQPIAPADAAAFPTLERWTRGIDEAVARNAALPHPLPPALVARAAALRRALLDSAPAPVLLHGDLHHENILASDRDPDGWLLIDPKGVVGERAYDCGPFLMNPIGWPRRVADPRALLRRRIALLADALALDPARIAGWAFVHCVLSAWWSASDGDGDGREALEVAGLME
jgi:streptomycin 6-kinase